MLAAEVQARKAEGQGNHSKYAKACMGNDLGTPIRGAQNLRKLLAAVLRGTPADPFREGVGEDKGIVIADFFSNGLDRV